MHPFFILGLHTVSLILKKSTSRFFFIALFVILLHGVFFLYALKQNNFYLQPDSSEYLNQRDNLIEHGSFYQGNTHEPHRWYLETRRPPLTGIVLAAIKLISDSDIAILIFQNLLSCFVLIFLLKILKKHYPDFNLLLLIPFLIFFPAQMIYSNFIMAEILFQALICTGFFFLLHAEKKVLLFFVFITMAAFVKPVLYLFWIPALITLFAFRKTFRLKLFHFSGAALMSAAVLLFSWFNYQRTGVFAFSSASESFLPDYVVLPVVQYAEGKENAIQAHASIQQAAQEKKNYSEYHRSLIHESMGTLKEYPLTTTVLWMKGAVLFFTDPGRWDVLAFRNKKPEEHQEGFFHLLKSQGINKAFNHLVNQGIGLTVFTLTGMLINGLLFFCFLIFLNDKRYPFLFRLMAGMIVFYLALMTGPIGSARYRVSVFPVLLIALPSGWSYLKDIFEKFTFRKKTG